MSDEMHANEPNSDMTSDGHRPTLQRKAILRSKTFWLQVVTIFGVFFPAVQAWLVANPVEFVAALGAVNVLVRFATRDEVTIFSSENGPEPGGDLWPVLILSAAAGFLGIPMPPCLVF